MNKEVLETYTMTPEEEIKWLRQCVRELQEKQDKYKTTIDKILKLKKYTSLIEYDEEFIKVKDIEKILEELDE